MTYELQFIMKGSGFFVNEMAGQALGVHKLVYRGADGLWYLADSDLAATMPTLGITMSPIAATRLGRILRQGYIGDSSWTWTIGDEIYASATAGELTQVIPAGIIQIIGVAVSAVMIYFNSDLGSGGAATAWIKQFYPAPNLDSNHGTYASQIMPDGEDTLIRQTFLIPEDVATVDSALIIIIPEAGGNIRRSVDTNFAQNCVETYQTHVDTIAAGQVAVNVNQITCLDFSAALTGAMGYDVVGIEFSRLATNALDTIDADVHYLGILISGAL